MIEHSESGLTDVKTESKEKDNQGLPIRNKQLVQNPSERRFYNERKLEILEIIKRDGEKSIKKLAKELKISYPLAKRLLQHYENMELVKIVRRMQYYNPETRKAFPGRPFNIYGLTDKGLLRLEQYSINRQRGYPLNLKKYPPMQESGDLG